MKNEEVANALFSMHVPVETIEKFLEWNSKNPTVWRMFERAALDLIKAGKTHWGAKAICELIRYKRAVEEGGQFDDYSVNNNFSAYYARVFIVKYPQYSHFFETREIRGLTK